MGGDQSILWSTSMDFVIVLQYMHVLQIRGVAMMIRNLTMTDPLLPRVSQFGCLVNDEYTD